jgi:hypothetical protein
VRSTSRSTPERQNALDSISTRYSLHGRCGWSFRHSRAPGNAPGSPSFQRHTNIAPFFHSWERRRPAGPLRYDRQTQLADETSALPGGKRFSICDWGIHWLSLKHDRSSAQPAETDHEGCSPDSGPFCRRACPRSNRKGIPQKRRRRDVATDQSRFKEIRGSLKRPSPHVAPRQTLARHIRLGNCH